MSERDSEAVPHKNAPSKNPPRISWRTTASLLVVVATLFTLSVMQRSMWFGTTPPGMAGWLTAGTTLCAKNWFREGPLHLRFGMFWDPASIETPTLESRTPYTSFPPGAIVPIYLLAKVAGQEPTPAMTMAYNLANHAAVAFILALIVLILARRWGFADLEALLFATVPAVLYLFLPAPSFEHQMGFFSDQAVMLPFALCLLLEVLDSPNNPKWRRFIAATHGVVAFWGITTDWLFVFVLLCLFVCRLVRGSLGSHPKPILARTVLFWAPVVLAMTLYAIQLAQLGAFDDTLDRFLQRASLDARSPLEVMNEEPIELTLGHFLTPGLKGNFWQHFIPKGYGAAGKPAVFAGFALLLFLIIAMGCRRFQNKAIGIQTKDLLTVLILTLLPCLLYTQALKNHTSLFPHSFAALKLALPLALLPAALLPAWGVALLTAREKQQRAGRLPAIAVALVSLLAVSLYLASLESEYDTLDLRMVHGPANGGISLSDQEPHGRFIGKHTTYNDVVFSSVQSEVTPTRAPHYMLYGMKRVYPANSLQEIAGKLADVHGPYVVAIVTSRKRLASTDGWKVLAEKPCVEVAGRLCKFDRETFWEALREEEITP